MLDQFSLLFWTKLLREFNVKENECLYIDEFEIHERCEVSDCKPFLYCQARIRLWDYPKAQLKLVYSHEQGVTIDTRFNIVKSEDMQHLTGPALDMMLKAVRDILKNKQQALALETETSNSISEFIKKLKREEAESEVEQ